MGTGREPADRVTDGLTALMTQAPAAIDLLTDYDPHVKAADQAVKLKGEYGEAHFERACALAQPGRLPEAMAALKRALELDEELAENLAEPDLKALAALPEFKKLLEEKGAEEVGPSTERKPVQGTAPAL